MAFIVLPYTLVDLDTLDPAQFNRNIFGGGAEGVVSEPNGRIQGANLDPAFLMKRHMLSKYEHFRLRQEEGTEPIDFMDDAFGNDAESKYVDIPGACIRYFLPFKAQVLFSVQAHVSLWRMWTGDATGEGGPDPPPDAIVRLSVNGSALAHTRWILPQTVFPKDDGSGGQEPYCCEHIAAAELSVCDMRELAAGWVEANFRLYLGMNETTENLTWDYDTQSGDPIVGETDYHTRVTFSLRNVTILALFER